METTPSIPAEHGANHPIDLVAKGGRRLPVLAEFFSGIGGAAVALLGMFKAAFSNEIDLAKAACQRLNLGHDVDTRSIEQVRAADLPFMLHLIWASFPCQDHSSLGKRRGFRKGQRGKLVYELIRILRERRAARLPLPALCLENVQYFVSHDGSRDFARLVGALVRLGYRVGAVMMEGADFGPARRKRVFIVAWPARVKPPAGILCDEADPRWATPALRKAVKRLSKRARASWRWLTMPAPQPCTTRVDDLLENLDGDGEDYPEERVRRWTGICHERDLRALRERAGAGTAVGIVDAQRSKCPVDGGWRHKFHLDGTAHCFTGGSVRQRLMLCRDGTVSMRDFSAREMARMTGLPDWFALGDDKRFVGAAVGEGLPIPCVTWLGQHVLHPVAEAVRAHHEAAEARARKAAELPPPPAPPFRQHRVVEDDDYGVKKTTARQDLHLTHADNERLTQLALAWEVPKQSVLRDLIDGGLEARGMPLLGNLPGGRRDRQPAATKPLPPRPVREDVLTLAREMAEAMLRERLAANDDVPKAKGKRFFGGGAAHSSAHGEWWTPRHLLDALVPALMLKDGRFTTDLFSPGAAFSHVPAEKHYTKEDDAMAAGKDWSGDLFFNPPYDRRLKDYVHRARLAVETGEARLVVGVIPARTETIWWNENVVGHADVIFVRRRVAFVDGTGASDGESPGHPTAIVLWGASPEQVARVRAAFPDAGYMSKDQGMERAA